MTLVHGFLRRYNRHVSCRKRELIFAPGPMPRRRMRACARPRRFQENACTGACGFLYRMKPEAPHYLVVKVDDDNLWSGLRFHRYKNPHAPVRRFPEIGGVCTRTHPTAWHGPGAKINSRFRHDHADYIAGEIPCTKVMRDKNIKGDYEEETGNLIVKDSKTSLIKM